MIHIPKPATYRRSALQITLVYAIAGSAWIGVSDVLLGHLGVTAFQLTRLATVKGLLFIAVTAIILYCLISRLLQRISVQQAALQASEQRLIRALEATGDLTQFYSLILETIHTGVWVADRNDIITYANHGMERISGLPADQIVGKNILKDLPESNYGDMLAIYRRTREEGKPVCYEAVPVQAGSGRKSYRSGWMVPLFSDGTFDGVICTVEDMTERMEAGKASARYQEQLRVMGSMRALDEELQRHQLATALHDGVGQLLAVARIKLSILRQGLSPDVADVPLTDLQEILDEAISATRSLTVEISPPILYQFGLEAALEGLVETFRNRHGLPATYREEGRVEPLNEETRIFLYQSVRELLMNALKHANAASVVVACERREDAVIVTVSDDGIGFAPPPAGGIPGSYGLFSIAERMHHLGGTINISSSPGQGTNVELIAPITWR